MQNPENCDVLMNTSSYLETSKVILSFCKNVEKRLLLQNMQLNGW